MAEVNNVATVVKKPEKRAPEISWETELKRMNFRNQEFSAFPDRMQDFLNNEGKLIRSQLDEALYLTMKFYRVYAPELLRSLVMGCVLTQNQLMADESGHESPTRKSESVMTAEGERALPAFIHPLRVYIRSLQMGVDPMIAKAAPIHDIREDARMKIGESIIEKDTILDLIRTEFMNGRDVAVLVEAVSKYDTIPPNITTTIKNHAFYKAIRNRLEQYLRRHDMPADQITTYEDSILKGISSVIKIHETLIKKTPAEEAYLQMVARSYLLKCLDINDNLRSPGTKPPILLRDRLFVTIARIMNSPLADEMLSNMTRYYKNDPMFADLKLEGLAVLLSDDEKRKYEERGSQFFVDRWGIKPESIRTGFRIPFLDEGQTTAVPQLIVRLKKAKIEALRGQLGNLVDDSTLAELTGLEGPGTLVEFNGVIENMMNVLGRDGLMLKVEQNGATTLYVRVIQDEPPDFQEYALKGYNKKRKSPEAKLFLPNFYRPDDETQRVNSFLTIRSLLFDPMSLIGSGIRVYASENGVISFPEDTPFEKVCAKHRLNPKRCKPVGILSGLPPEQMPPDEPPVFELKKIVA